jgi:hypothetical protein
MMLIMAAKAKVVGGISKNMSKEDLTLGNNSDYSQKSKNRPFLSKKKDGNRSSRVTLTRKKACDYWACDTVLMLEKKKASMVLAVVKWSLITAIRMTSGGRSVSNLTLNHALHSITKENRSR